MTSNDLSLCALQAAIDVGSTRQSAVELGAFGVRGGRELYSNKYECGGRLQPPSDSGSMAREGEASCCLKRPNGKNRANGRGFFIMDMWMYVGKAIGER
jgi:hypothetical protein